MKISEKGLELIKSFEGLRLTSYKAVSSEKYYTIGYGHYGSDVRKDMTITESQAEELLKKDVEKFENKVNKYSNYNFNQNQFDALVSFAYNIGNIDQLTAKGTRTIEQISSHISLYVKAGGKTLAGLVKRREKEKELFDTPVESSNTSTTDTFYPKCDIRFTSIVDALKSIEVDSTYSSRKKIADKNGITKYVGLDSQNIELLSKLKKGVLIAV